MKKLYLKLLELLGEIEEIEFIDVNLGQVYSEAPALNYPCVLIDMNISSTDTYQDRYQEISAQFSLTLVTKAHDVHSLHPKEIINHSLAHFDLAEKIQEKIQGYEDDFFRTFNRLSMATTPQRAGLNTIVINYETNWQEDAPKS